VVDPADGMTKVLCDQPTPGTASQILYQGTSLQYR
jgi:hypothetical protein